MTDILPRPINPQNNVLKSFLTAIGFKEGAVYAVQNYPINWINPEVELPTEFDEYDESEMMAVLVDDKIEPFVEWTFYSKKDNRWSLKPNYGRGIGWSRVNLPEWYNKGNE